jgi:hypothetical protein
MSFLSGLGRGLQRTFDGNNLAIAQAILAGDYHAAAALRARQEDVERQRQQEREQADARDAQVIGAKNMGFSSDEIGAMSGPALSWMARERAATPPGDADAAGRVVGGGAPAEKAVPRLAPPSGPFAPMISAAAVSPAPRQLGVAPGSSNSRRPGSPPRVRTPAQLSALPRGTPFITPDGSIRTKI